MFLSYLNDWEKSVLARKKSDKKSVSGSKDAKEEKFSKCERNMMMLSRETLLGLKMTGVCYLEHTHTHTP